MTLARVGWLAAALMFVGVPGGGAEPSGATRAAAPFAEAWAHVPSSAAARKAANVVVFGGHANFSGFNTALACCNQLWAGFVGANEALHGAYIQDANSDWIRDLVSTASATSAGISYTIKPNAYWYWGGKRVPVTYRDFLYTLQKIDDPNDDVATRVGYSQLDPTRYTHRGDKQVTFFWRTTNCSTDYPCGPYANWQFLFGQLYPSFALAGLDFNKIWTDCICGNDGQPVSDGPFYLSNYSKDRGATLKANPYYYAKAKLAEVDFRFIADPIAEEQAMRGGQVDAIAPSFAPVLLPLKGAPGIVFDQAPGYVFEHIELREGSAKAGPNVNSGASNALLRAPWLREVIMLGIDRQRIINGVFGRLAGNLEPMQSVLFFPTQTGYRPDFKRWNYDPSKALAILKKHCVAGSGPSVPSADTTKIWQCAGLPATFEWTWAAGRDDWTTSEQIASGELRSIGIGITERPLPTNAVFGSTGVPSGRFDVVQFRTITSGDPGDWYDTYRCFGEGNYTGYCSHTVDALLKAANGELTPLKRTRLFQQADHVMATQVPVIPLYQVPIVLIHRSDLLGMRANPGVAGPVWNIEDWHWRS
jgi:peptide/nickel transport system substrate-binding protein